MAISRNDPPDLIGSLQRKIKDLETELRKVRNEKNPTIPVYNKDALPSDLLEQQIFIGTDFTLNFVYNRKIYSTAVLAVSKTLDASEFSGGGEVTDSLAPFAPSRG